MRRIMEAIQRFLSGLAEAAEWTLGLPFRLLGGAFRPAVQHQSRQQTQQAASEAQKTANEKSSKVDTAVELQRVAGLVQRAAAWKSRGRDFQKTFGELMSPAHITWVKALTQQECVTLAHTDVRVVCAFLSGRQETIPGVRSLIEIAMQQDKVRQPRQVEGQQQVRDRLAQRMGSRDGLRHVHDADCELPVNASSMSR